MKQPPNPPQHEKNQPLDTREVSQFESFLDNAPISFLLLDSSGVILEANLPAARLLSKERRLLKGLPLCQFILEADRKKFDRHLDRHRSNEARVSSELRLALPGAPVAELLSSTFHPSESTATLLQVIIHERRANGNSTAARETKEGEIQRLSRTLRALTRSSHAMMRAVDEEGYMNEVCRIVQEDCGHAMVWIGFACNDEQKSLKPAAYAGFEEGYLETLRLTWADTERGRGPTGTAVRTGQPCVCRNMLIDPRFAPWREEATRRGYAASIALPLMNGPNAFGAITIYSREIDPFSEDEVKLLSELADDLSYGLAALRLRASHKAAERSLHESEQRHRALFENMSEGFALHEIITDSHGSPCDYRFLELNPAFVRLTGLERENLLGKRVLEVLPGNEPAWIERYGRVALTGEPAHFENFSAPLNRWYEVFAYRPAPLQFAVIFTDITQRKRAEEERREVDERVHRKLQSVLEPEGDLGALDLSDLIDVPAMQKLMDDFYAVSRFPMSIVDMQGRVLVGVGWQDICTRFHRVHPETCKLCTESDTQLSVGVPKGEFRLYKCKNSLWDIATPVIVAGRQVGNIFSGQFFFDDEQIDRDRFRDQARRYGFGETQYLAALEQVPRLSRDTVDRGMAFLLKLADMLSKLGYSNVMLARLLSERDRLAASLRESRKKYQALVESMRDFIWELDSQGRYTYCSPQMEVLWGLKPDEMIGKTPFELVPEAQRSAVLESFLDYVKSPRPFSGLEIASNDSRGRLVHIEISGVPFYDGDGKLLGFRGISRDITESRRAAEALRLSEEKFARAFANNPAALALTRLKDGLFFDVNDTWLTLQGFTREETIGNYAWKMNIWPTQEMAMRFVRELKEKGSIHGWEQEFHRKTGETVIVQLSAQVLSFQGETLVLSTVVDITARKKMEEALRELNAQLEQRVQDRTAAIKKMSDALDAERKRFMDVLDVLPAYVILLSKDYHIPFANRYFEERFGKSLGRRCYEYLFNRSEPCEPCETFRTLKENAPVKWEWAGPDGRTYDISDFPFTDTDGSKLILEMGIDITDRKRAEAELEKHRHHLEDLVQERTSQLSAANLLLQSEIAERKEAELALSESEERFRLAIQHSKLMAWQCDREMRFTWVYNSHFGLPGSELLDRTPADLGNEEGMKEFVAHCREVLAQGAGTRKTIKHVHPDGRERHFDQQVEALRDPQGHIVGLIGISLDVTERVQAEHRLHRSEESFRLMIGHSAEPMLLVDETGMIECISRKAADQMGFSETELIGTNVGRFLDWSAKLDLTMRLEDFLRHAPIPARAVLRVKTNNGCWCWIDVQAGFVNYGQRPEKYLLKFEVIDTEMNNSSQ